MPRVYGTRKQRARELLDRLRRGPSLSGGDLLMSGKRGLSVQEAEWQVKNWLGSWITHEVIDLVPELKQQERNKQ